MPQERLDIVISQRGAKTVSKDINSIGKEAEKAAKGTSLLKRVLGGIGAGLAIRAISNLADSYTTMQNRLKTVTKSQLELNEATAEVFKIANRSRQGVAGVVEFYARLSGAAKELGRSQSELLAITETVTKAVALSGATTAESAGALRQLSQGLGSGTLRGQELNSVLEQLPIIADIIADSLGVARGELRALAEQGKLTADVVVTALEGASGRIAKAFEQSTPTIAGSFTVLVNNLTQFVGQVDQASGASRILSSIIQLVANNVDVLAGLIIAVAVPAIALLTRSWLAFAAVNPVLLLASAATAAVVFGGSLKVSEDKGTTMFDVFRAGFQTISEGLTQMAKDSSKAFKSLTEDNTAAAGDFDNPWRIGLLLIAGYMDDLMAGNAALGSGILTLFKGLGQAIVQLMEYTVNKSIELLNGLLKSLASIAEASNKMLSGITGIKMPKVTAPQIPDLGEGTTRTLNDFKNPWASLAADFKESFEFLRNGGRTGLTVKSFFEDALQEADKAAAASKKLAEDRKAAAEAAGTSIVNSETQISSAVEKTLVKLREQVRLFGLTESQGQIQGLKDSGAGPGQVQEAESLQKQAAILQQFSDIVGGGTALFSEIVAFQEQAAALQQQTSNAAQTVQAEASLKLAEGSQAIAQASQTLFAQVSTFLNAAADLALSEVEVKFTGGAATIGTATAQAFAAAFSGSLSGALGSILGNISFNAGDAGNLLNGAANAAGNGGTVSPALQAQIRQVEEAKARVAELRNELDLVGQSATQNFNRGSAAAQQFGQNTTNIGTQINNVFQNAFGGLESALTQFVTTGKLDFKSLINSIIADLARMVVQMLIIKPLMGFFGGIFGGFFGFSQGGFVGNNLPGFATGGIVGGFGGSTSDNQLARLSPGEFVMNADSTRRNRAALEYTNDTGRMPVLYGGGGGTQVFAPTIIVESSGRQQDGESQAADIEAAVRRAWQEEAVRSQRSGAVFGRNKTSGGN